MDVEAPREGRPTTRVNWLVRQLANAPDATRIESFAAYARGAGTAELLQTVRQDPAALVADASREIKSFRIATTTTLGAKRGRGRGAFIDSVLDAIDAFYADVLGGIKVWSAKPPKMRPESAVDTADAEPTHPASLASTDYSSQDGPALVNSVEESAASATVDLRSNATATEEAHTVSVVTQEPAHSR